MDQGHGAGPPSEFSRGARIAGITALTLVGLATFAVLGSLLVMHKHWIASSAMTPTLSVNEYVMVAPTSLAGEPQPGDVTTFWVQMGDHRAIFIMRVIAGPGERISLQKGIVSVNGTPLPREDLGLAPPNFPDEHNVRLYRESLPNGRSYLVRDDPADGFYDDVAEITVPAGHYIMMGDNRDNSNDSRNPKIGPIAAADVTGKAKLVYFAPDLSRVGTWVR